MAKSLSRPLAVAYSVGCLFIATLLLQSLWNFRQGPTDTRPDQYGCYQSGCLSDKPKQQLWNAPHPNAWSELTAAEARSATVFLESEPSLRGDNASAPLTIMWMEAIRPNKSDALSLLSGHTDSPERYAKVMIPQDINGTTRLNYFSVGPLPAGPGTTVTPLTWPFKSGQYGIKSPLTSFEEFQLYGAALGKNITDITEALLGAHMTDENDRGQDSLRVNARATHMEDGVAHLWMGFMRTGPRSSAWSILPQGLWVKLRATSEVDQGFEQLAWYYNGGFYEDVEELRAAISEPGFVKAGANLDGDWTETDDMTENEERSKPPPVMVQPEGPRYKYDASEQYVSYMGWSFYFTSTLATGPALFDIRFKNDSVMYELTLNEAMAHYAGDDPIQGGQEFLDAAFGMGKYAFELVPGYDCPAYADYADATYHVLGKPVTNKRSICIFESTADYLLQRHTSQRQVTVSRNTYLTLRYVSTVGNYDYTIDYTFYLDGTLEVKVRASGYIFAAFYSNTTLPSQAPNSTHPPGSLADRYGYRIHDAISSSMHDHVLSFKADMDVAGEPNTFTRVAIDPIQRSYPWEQPEVPVRNTMALHEKPVTHETGLDWPRNGGEMYVVSHADKRNKWGERRGYRITPGTGMGTPPHLTVENSTSLGRSAMWAEHDLWVLRRKDEERSSGDPSNWFQPLDPLVDFSTYVDNEALLVPDDEASSSESADSGQITDRNANVDEYDGDLVVYFNLGAHHVPHSGDIPNTLMHTSASGVMFVPHNFNDRDPSRRTAQGVRMSLDGKNGAGWMKQHGGQYSNERVGGEEMHGAVENVAYFGGHYDRGVRLEKGDLEPDLEGYDGGKEDAELTLSGTIFGGI